MKVAIQISGDFRVLHLCLPRLQKYVLSNPHYEVDFFIHTWEHVDDAYGTFPFEGRNIWHLTMLVYSHNVGLGVFKPKKYMVESYPSKTDLAALPRAMSMYYGIWMANQLRKAYTAETGTQYDVVMRYRTDCMLDCDPFRSIPQTGAQAIMIPTSSVVESSDNGGLCDWIAWGIPEAMDVYCNTYMHWLKKSPMPAPEVMLQEALESWIVERPQLPIYLVEGTGEIRGTLRNGDNITYISAVPGASRQIGIGSNIDMIANGK